MPEETLEVSGEKVSAVYEGPVLESSEEVTPAEDGAPEVVAEAAEA